MFLTADVTAAASHLKLGLSVRVSSYGLAISPGCQEASRDGSACACAADRARQPGLPLSLALGVPARHPVDQFADPVDPGPESGQSCLERPSGPG
jgi:hypothetical protein